MRDAVASDPPPPPAITYPWLIVSFRMCRDAQEQQQQTTTTTTTAPMPEPEEGAVYAECDGQTTQVKPHALHGHVYLKSENKCVCVCACVSVYVPKGLPPPLSLSLLSCLLFIAVSNACSYLWLHHRHLCCTVRCSQNNGEELLYDDGDSLQNQVASQQRPPVPPPYHAPQQQPQLAPHPEDDVSCSACCGMRCCQRATQWTQLAFSPYTRTRSVHPPSCQLPLLLPVLRVMRVSHPLSSPFEPTDLSGCRSAPTARLWSTETRRRYAERRLRRAASC